MLAQAHGEDVARVTGEYVAVEAQADAALYAPFEERGHGK